MNQNLLARSILRGAENFNYEIAFSHPYPYCYNASCGPVGYEGKSYHASRCPISIFTKLLGFPS